MLLTDGGTDADSVRATCDVWIGAALAPAV